MRTNLFIFYPKSVPEYHVFVPSMPSVSEMKTQEMLCTADNVLAHSVAPSMKSLHKLQDFEVSVL